MKLTILNGSTENKDISTENSTITIGRDSTNDIVLENKKVSRNHAIIALQDNRFSIKDLGSSNGTYVNNMPVTEHVLENGDIIRICNVQIRITWKEDHPPTAQKEDSREQVTMIPTETPIPSCEINVRSTVGGTTFFDMDFSKTTFESMKRSYQSLAILCRISNAVKSIFEEKPLFERICDFISEAVPCERIILMLKNPSTKELEPQIIRKISKGNKPFAPITISQAIIDRVMTRNVSLLCHDATTEPEFADSDSVHIYGIKSAMCVPLQIKGITEGILYADVLSSPGQFDEEDLKLFTAIADQTAMTIENVRLYKNLQEQERIKRELAIAKEIQEILLPKEFPIIEGFDIAFRTVEAEEIGGDYYDCFHLDDNHLGIVIADVSGKGIPGAIVMAMFRSTLHAMALQNFSPSSILYQVNKTIIKDIKQDMFISSTFAILNIKDKTLSFARAGHLPLLHYKKKLNEFDFIKPKGMVLGISDWTNPEVLEEATVSLNPEDILVFYTDGVEESSNSNNEEFGREGICQSVKKSLDTIKDVKSKTILETLYKDIYNYICNSTSKDDITVGILKVE
ncbi:MAG: SpoIIE family protein phosphatase [Candidatus Theseobacter exili]|nr:SpoIIE family protein phosphatase [Candidatus Theseobacter exili]